MPSVWEHTGGISYLLDNLRVFVDVADDFDFISFAGLNNQVISDRGGGFETEGSHDLAVGIPLYKEVPHALPSLFGTLLD